MKIGVISDTHDNIQKTAEAIRLLKEHGAELLIHCGDICRPETVLLFQDVPTHFVFGNNDDPTKLIATMDAIGVHHHVEFGQLTLAGKEIAWVHSHRWDQLQRLENSNEFDYLFYGHTHEVEIHRTGKTLVANPGALHRARPKTCLLVDLGSGALQTIQVSSK